MYVVIIVLKAKAIMCHERNGGAQSPLKELYIWCKQSENNDESRAMEAVSLYLHPAQRMGLYNKFSGSRY